MWNLISQVARLFNRQKINSDSMTFKFCYRFLSSFLVISAVVTFGNNYFGTHMQCMTTSKEMEQILTHVCWSQGTWIYASPDDLQSFRYQLAAIAPGVHGGHAKIGPGLQSKTDPEPEKIYHMIYAYIPFVYILMAISCHFGRYLWFRTQGTTLSQLIRDLRNPTISRDAMDRMITESAERFVGDIRQHNAFAISYFISVFINLLVLVAQMIVIRVFFANDDWLFGYTALSWVDEPYHNWPHQLAVSFPQATKCTIKSYGISGNIVKYDALCFLSTNKINLINFAIHWWILAILVPVTFLELCGLVLKFWSKKYRKFDLCSALTAHPQSDIGVLSEQLNYGSVFVIKLLAKNIPIDFVCKIGLEVKTEFETNSIEISRNLHGFQ